MQTIKLVLSLSSLFSISIARAGEEGTFIPNPDIHTLVYNVAPVIDAQLMQEIQKRALNSLYKATLNTELIVDPAQNDSMTRVSTAASPNSSIGSQLNQIQSSLKAGAASMPNSFSFVYKYEKAQIVKGPNIQALLIVPNLVDFNKEYRIILEAPALKEDGSQALTIEDAVNDSILKDFKVVQIKECSPETPWSETETIILDAEHDKVVLI